MSGTRPPVRTAAQLLCVVLVSLSALLIQLPGSASVAAAAGPIADLPARTGPLVEIAAVEHAALPTRLFAS